ncbi:MAG: LysR family transcriptional regulator [Candidatus Thermoplasmatota archaeon]|nr:LysR family transcriptional regulator [Candidatus Thermoplasmatota archaeon]
MEIDTKCVIGEGRAELLHKIKQLGSLSDVARSMCMAYSHAWSEIKEISDAAGGPVIKTSRGGKEGGSSYLTELGEKILNQFDEEKKSLEEYLSKRNEL